MCSAGNVDVRKPVPDLMATGFAKLFSDKGYLSKALTGKLKHKGVELITRVRKNMKSVSHSAFDEVILRRRSFIETVFDELKNLCQIDHSRHRSPINFTVNLLAGLVAYCLMPKKLALPLRSGFRCTFFNYS